MFTDMDLGKSLFTHRLFTFLQLTNIQIKLNSNLAQFRTPSHYFTVNFMQNVLTVYVWVENRLLDINR